MLRFLYGNSSLEGFKFRFKGKYKKAVKEPYEEKGLSADEFYWPVLKSIISQRLVGFTRQKKETKNHAACVLVICCLTRVINGKIIEDEAIYNFWRFLVEDFFLPVIKPPGTYFNNKNKSGKTVQGIRLEYIHRGQTYLTASHSQLRYFCYVGGMARTMASLQAFPSTVLSRAWSRAVIPFPFPFERLPRRLV